MKNSFFDEHGMLNIDEMVLEQQSFKKIMADDIVTDVELQEQGQLVADLYKEVEKNCNEEQLALIKRLIAESAVLQTIYHFHELQNLK